MDIAGNINIADHHFPSGCEQSIHSFPNSSSHHHSSLRIANASSTNITFFCTKLYIDSKYELLIIFFDVSRFLLNATTGTIHVLEVLSTICGSNFDAKPFSSQIFFIQKCRVIAGSIVCSKGSEFQFALNTELFSQPTFVPKHIEQSIKSQRTLCNHYYSQLTIVTYFTSYQH